MGIDQELRYTLYCVPNLKWIILNDGYISKLILYDTNKYKILNIFRVSPLFFLIFYKLLVFLCNFYSTI